MPKTEAETKTLANFVSQYGDERGQRIFYAMINAKRAAAKKGSKRAKAYLSAIFSKQKEEK